MRSAAQSLKTLPRAWLMSLAVRKSPEMLASCLATDSASRICCSCRAWKGQRQRCDSMRSMRHWWPRALVKRQRSDSAGDCGSVELTALFFMLTSVSWDLGKRGNEGGYPLCFLKRYDSV